MFRHNFFVQLFSMHSCGANYYRAVGSKNSGDILEFSSNKQFCHGRPSNQGEKNRKKKFLHFFLQIRFVCGYHGIRKSYLIILFKSSYLTKFITEYY